MPEFARRTQLWLYPIDDNGHPAAGSEAEIHINIGYNGSEREVLKRAIKELQILLTEPHLIGDVGCLRIP